MRVFNRNILNTLWADSGSRSTIPPIKVQQGWTAEKPPFEYENERRNFQEETLAYIYQNGIPEWHVQQEYPQHALCRVGAVTYRAIADTTGDNPATTPAKWERAFEDYQDVAGQLADLQQYVDDQDTILDNKIAANKVISDNADNALQDDIAALDTRVDGLETSLATEVTDRMTMGTNLSDLIAATELQIKRTMFESVFPVGSIYVGDNTENPNTRWESVLGYTTTWVKIENRFLFGAADFETPLFSNGDIAGTTAGAREVTLTVDNLPPHNHLQRADSDGGSDAPQVTNVAGSLDGLRGQTDPLSTGKTGVYTSNTGSGTAVDIMPPLRVTRFWRRTA